MRKIKDVLRLKFEGKQPHQQIADALELSKGVVTKYVGLAVAAGLDWPAVSAMDEATLERRLLASPRPSDIYAQADFGRMHQELGRKAKLVAKKVTPEPPLAPNMAITTPPLTAALAKAAAARRDCAKRSAS